MDQVSGLAGDVRTVEWLLDAGEDINVAGDMGQTPAHSAATNLHKDAFDILMARGADPRIEDEFGKTPAATWDFFAKEAQEKRT